MVNHLHRNPPRLRLRKRTRSIAMQRRPGLFVDLRLQRALQRFIRIVRPQKLSMPHEKALFVVVRIHEPARDPIRVVAVNLSRARVEHIHAIHLHPHLAARLIQDRDVRFAEDHEQVALAGALQVVRHVQIGVHAGFQDSDAAHFVDVTA